MAHDGLAGLAEEGNVGAVSKVRIQAVYRPKAKNGMVKGFFVRMELQRAEGDRECWELRPRHSFQKRPRSS